MCLKQKFDLKGGKACAEQTRGIHYIMFWFANAMLITGESRLQ